MRACPSNGNLARADAVFTRYSDYRVQRLRALCRVLRLEHTACEPFSTPRFTLPVLSGQHTAPQGRPSHDAETERMRCLEQIGLGLAMHQAMFELRSRNRNGMGKFGQRDRTGEAPGGEVRQARVQDLAGTRQSSKPRTISSRGVVPSG